MGAGRALGQEKGAPLQSGCKRLQGQAPFSPSGFWRAKPCGASAKTSCKDDGELPVPVDRTTTIPVYGAPSDEDEVGSRCLPQRGAEGQTAGC